MSRKSYLKLWFDSNRFWLFLSISFVVIYFSTTFYSNTVLAESQQYIFIKKWGSRCDAQDNGSCIHKNDGQFSDPTGLAIDSSDNVYVIDYFNHRVEKFKADGTFVTKWGSFGTREGQLNYATGIATDKDGFVYVADTNNNRIEKFTSDGTFVSSCFDGSNTFAVAVDKNGFIYVTFANGNVIKKFTNDCRLVTQWGSPGTGDGQFTSTFGIAVDKDGFVYVADSDVNSGHPGNIDRVQKFTSDGTFVTKWGSFGTGDGQFSNPWGIGINSKGNVYVSDFINNNIQVFVLKTDNIFPDTQITSATDGNGNSISNDSSTVSNKMTFTFTGSDNVDVARFECSIDGSPFTNCNSPITFNGLKAGITHTFKVRAIDTAGNVDPTPATFSWKVLTTIQAINDIIQQVKAMHLHDKGVEIALLAPLNSIILSETTSKNNTIVTCALLDVFENEVNSFTIAGQLTPIQSSSLLQSSQNLMKSLGCKTSIPSNFIPFTLPFH